jgi:hypothetical protein
MMTASKSVAAAVSGPVVVIADWLLTLIPGWAGMPSHVQTAFVTLVTTIIPAAIVYFAPANQWTVAVADGAVEKA